MKKIFTILIIIALLAIVSTSGCVNETTQEVDESLFEIKDFGNGLYLITADDSCENFSSAMFALGKATSKIIGENPEMKLSSMTPYTIGGGYSGGITVGYYLYFTKDTDVVNN